MHLTSTRVGQAEHSVAVKGSTRLNERVVQLLVLAFFKTSIFKPSASTSNNFHMKTKND